jgi:hypothetical protein
MLVDAIAGYEMTTREAVVRRARRASQGDLQLAKVALGLRHPAGRTGDSRGASTATRSGPDPASRELLCSARQRTSQTPGPLVHANHPGSPSPAPPRTDRDCANDLRIHKVTRISVPTSRPTMSSSASLTHPVGGCTATPPDRR